MRPIRLLRKLKDDARGAYTVELAMISPLFFALIFGTLELGYYAFARSQVSGQLEEAARTATLSTASMTVIESDLTGRIKHVLPNATVTVRKRSIKRFSGLTTAERVLSDAGNDGYHAGTGDCYEDVNNNGVRDAVSATENSIGGADDIAVIEVDATYPRFFPVGKILPRMGNTATIHSEFVARRQPFASQAPAPTRCN